MKNYYQILEVEPEASGERIKEQYLFLVQAWHPDKFSKADQKTRAEEKVKQLNAAYEILKSPAKRAEYDQKLQSSNKTKAPPPAQVRPQPVPPPPVKVRPIKKAPGRSRGLFPIIGTSSRDLRGAPQERIRVFINGQPRFVGVDELVHARVQYFLNGASQGIIEFTSRQHVQAAVGQVAAPRGYEIHVLRLAPYQDRPEQVYVPKVKAGPRR